MYNFIINELLPCKAQPAGSFRQLIPVITHTPYEPMIMNVYIIRNKTQKNRAKTSTPD